ncbi:hypothetical protein HYC85_028725 [Camellia sinensis]|uniref:Uncharacterized protein n=1 Tax=Camellia sinensis TaxID=4442 RepID=A0A7J7FZZ8_CAMSI|nr:hypothetical protein HYC85_028725 [Camellia sinensis]
MMRWRAKASMVTTRPSDKDQIRMIVRNLHGKFLQRMIVLPLFTFPDLHEMGVQIEDAIRQGIFAEDNVPLKKNVVCSSNATTDGSTVAKCSEVDTITTSLNGQKPTTSTRPQAQNFHPLYMSLSQALRMLREEGYLELLEPQPVPNPLSPRYDRAKYYAYHQQHDHDTNRCIRLCHKIQDLIDEETIAPPKGPQVSTHPSPPHLNLIHTLPSAFNPSIYITPAYLSKPEVFIP